MFSRWDSSCQSSSAASSGPSTQVWCVCMHACVLPRLLSLLLGKQILHIVTQTECEHVTDNFEDGGDKCDAQHPCRVHAPTTSNFSRTIINDTGYMSYKAVKNRDIAEYVSCIQCGCFCPLIISIYGTRIPHSPH